MEDNTQELIDTENEQQNDDVQEIVQMTYAIAYARVSTDDKGQNPESQLMAIRKWAKKNSVVILKEFKDESTGQNDDRPGLDQAYGYIMRNHRNDKKHLITMFIVLDSDRLSRNMRDTNKLIEELTEMSVKLKYVAAENIDPSTPDGMLMNTFKAHTAEGYVSGHGQKVKAGLMRARAEGKHIGRPLSRVDKFDIDLLLAYADMGYSLRDVASVHSVSRLTVTRRLKDEDKLDEFKNRYAQALAQGKVGPALKSKKYKPKKEKPTENERDGD